MYVCSWLILAVTSMTVAALKKAVPKGFTGMTDEYIISAASPIIVKEDIGVALLPSNILAQSTENIFQSVFYKVSKPRNPTGVCQLECSPNLNQIQDMVNFDEENGCWGHKMHVFEASVLDLSRQATPANCLIQCLTHSRCKMISYDPETEKCWLQNALYYRLDAIDQATNSKSSLLQCLLDNKSVSRESLCKKNNSLFDEVLDSVVKNHNSEMESLIKKYEDVSQAYNLDLEKTKRIYKRSWNDFDFLGNIPVIGHFYELLKSPSDNRRMKQHLNSLENRFTEFAGAVQEHAQSSRVFQNEILEIVEHSLNEIHEKILGIKCDITSLAILMKYQQDLQVYLNKLKELMFAPKHGKLQSSLPQTLKLEDLELIVQNNPNFEETLFMSHPEILYRVGDIYLMKLTEEYDSVLFYFLLVAPKLNTGSLHRIFPRSKSQLQQRTVMHVLKLI